MDVPQQIDNDPWPALQARLRSALGASTFELWFRSVAPRSFDGSTLELVAPAETARWVSRRFARLLADTTRDLLGDHVVVRLVPSQVGDRSEGARGRDDQTSPAMSKTPGRRPRVPGSDGSTIPPEHVRRERALNPRYSFDQFIIGPGNRLAHAAALSVAELPGQAYNPLFLHAPPGLGKTHLLHAIGNYVRAYGGATEVRYTTAEAFTNHFVHAIAARSGEAFKRTYRSADVLLIDDIQFLADKAKTEEEFFHTFDELHVNGRQLVITCDRLPSQLRGIEQRLRERFEAGLVAEIEPPEVSTRLAILRKRVSLDAISIDDPGVLELIAARVTDNIRALEGALIRVVAYHSLTGRPIDTDLTTQVLDTIHPIKRTDAAPLTAPEIRDHVAAAYQVPVAQLLSSNRSARTAWVRQVGIYLTRELTDLSLPAIGIAFDRNHATVLHACKRVNERLTTDQTERAFVENLRRALLAQQNDRTG